jgi:hypothetical protein
MNRTILTLLLIVPALGLTGCLRDRDKANDPLFNLPGRSSSNQSSVSVRETDGRNSAGLASRSADSGLGIRDTSGQRDPSLDRTPVQPTGWTGAPGASGADGSPRLQTPTVASGPHAAGAPAMIGGVARLRTFEEGEAYLNARGCLWQRLEQREGEWFFSCSVPNRGNSNSVKTYEASDKYGLLAMQKVIDEINKEQSR